MHMYIASAVPGKPGLLSWPSLLPKKGICHLQPPAFVRAGLNNATRAAELHPEESQRPPHVWLEDLQRAKVKSLQQLWQLKM